MLLGIRLIIYDLDGVLIDSNPAIRESIIHSLLQYNLQYDIEEIMKQMGTPLIKIFEETFNEKDQNKIPYVLQEYKKYYMETGKNQLTLHSNVIETLSYFSANGITQCIASNSSRDLMEPILAELGPYEFH